MSRTTKEAALSDGAADALRARLRARGTDARRERMLDFGEGLHQIHSHRRHLVRWGFERWNDWVEAELGISPKTADYYRLIYLWFRVEHPLPGQLEARLERLEWTKVRILVGKLTALNAERLLALAETSTRRELETRTRTINEGQPSASNTEPSRLVRLYLPDQGDDASPYAIFKTALTTAKRVSGSDSDGHNVTLICQDFLAGAAARARTLSQYLRGLERVLRVALVAVDPRTLRVLHGTEAVEALIDATGNVTRKAKAE